MPTRGDHRDYDCPLCVENIWRDRFAGNQDLVMVTSEFDIYVPLMSSDRKAYAYRVISNYRQMIIAEFGGLTDFRYKLQGVWRIGTVEFYDRILLWRVLVRRPKSARKFLRIIKKRMEQELQQQKILIVER